MKTRRAKGLNAPNSDELTTHIHLQTTVDQDASGLEFRLEKREVIVSTTLFLYIILENKTVVFGLG